MKIQKLKNVNLATNSVFVLNALVLNKAKLLNVQNVTLDNHIEKNNLSMESVFVKTVMLMIKNNINVFCVKLKAVLIAILNKSAKLVTPQRTSTQHQTKTNANAHKTFILLMTRVDARNVVIK